MPFSWDEQDDVLVIVATGVIRIEDVPQLALAEHAYVPRVTAARFLCDCTKMVIISPEAAAELLRLMVEDNSVIHRSAFVVAGHGVTALQMRRMVREARSERRRVFSTFDDAWAWLRGG
jgi:hypothetical protein